jgi:hypothetical protein
LLDIDQDKVNRQEVNEDEECDDEDAEGCLGCHSPEGADLFSFLLGADKGIAEHGIPSEKNKEYGYEDY